MALQLPLTSSFKAMEEHITQLGVEDLKLYKAMRRWHNEIADMLDHVNGVLSPRGFDEIVKDDRGLAPDVTAASLMAPRQ
jgi:hypothetical protein